jgi:4-methyl-5(b-hydroxyethyl)-thiazole monophosphate biosynthesis
MDEEAGGPRGASSPTGMADRRTLAILYPGSIPFEILLAAHLVGAKWPTDVVTPDGKDHRGPDGLVFRAAGSFASVPPSAYGCVLVPGGDPGSVVGDASLRTLLSRLAERDAVLGAICAGPLLLAASGVLGSRRFTHGYTPEQHEFLARHWGSARYVDEPVVVDGRVVTAKPNAYVPFAVEVALLAGAIGTREDADRLRSYDSGS